VARRGVAGGLNRRTLEGEGALRWRDGPGRRTDVAGPQCAVGAVGAPCARSGGSQVRSGHGKASVRWCREPLLRSVGGVCMKK
jgi:hypothetical protein